jgi:hypothetical protein
MEILHTVATVITRASEAIMAVDRVIKVDGAAIITRCRICRRNAGATTVGGDKGDT